MNVKKIYGLLTAAARLNMSLILFNFLFPGFNHFTVLYFTFYTVTFQSILTYYYYYYVCYQIP